MDLLCKYFFFNSFYIRLNSITRWWLAIYVIFLTLFSLCIAVGVHKHQYKHCHFSTGNLHTPLASRNRKKMNQLSIWTSQRVIDKPFSYHLPVQFCTSFLQYWYVGRPREIMIYKIKKETEQENNFINGHGNMMRWKIHMECPPV